MIGGAYGLFATDDLVELAKAGVAIDFKEIIMHAERMNTPFFHPTPTLSSSPVSEDSPEELRAELFRRLRRPHRHSQVFADTHDFPFQAVCCVKLSADKIAVFVVNNGVPQILEDEYNTFPSDTLITQLRLLEGK